MAEKTAMEEMDEALGDVVEEPASELETPEGEEAPEETSEETPEGEETPEEEEGEEERGPNGERERNPDGTWKAAPKLDEKGKPIAEPKKPDPLNDPIPKELKKDTQERIRTLIDTAKTVTAERDELKTNFDFMVNGIQATGATPAQYGETLSWLALFNSGDPKQQEKALELVENVAERLATLLGKERAIGDPLGAHADLKEAVRTGKLTPEFAKEIARTRNGQQFRTELTTSATQEQQRQQQAQREEADGRKALTELEQTLIASDPDYARKKAILVPALKPLMLTVPWPQRKDKFLEAYKNLKLPKAAPKKEIPANQPLRAGKQPAGGQTRAPANALEAMNAALSGMNK
jgi:hypothetical protein